MTSDPEALRAIHEFLRFQITDHQTGDSVDLASRETCPAFSSDPDKRAVRLNTLGLIRKQTTVIFRGREVPPIVNGGGETRTRRLLRDTHAF